MIIDIAWNGVQSLGICSNSFIMFFCFLSLHLPLFVDLFLQLSIRFAFFLLIYSLLFLKLLPAFHFLLESFSFFARSDSSMMLVAYTDSPNAEASADHASECNEQVNPPGCLSLRSFGGGCSCRIGAWICSAIPR